jgi:hypothetical protein
MEIINIEFRHAQEGDGLIMINLLFGRLMAAKLFLLPGEMESSSCLLSIAMEQVKLV